MSPEQIRIAVAELHGWEWSLEGYWKNKHKEGKFHERPDYLNDLNAVHEVFLSLPFEMRLHYTHHLMIVTKFQDQMTGCLTNLANATAAQRCEALLRAKGLWKE